MSNKLKAIGMPYRPNGYEIPSPIEHRSEDVPTSYNKPESPALLAAQVEAKQEAASKLAAIGTVKVEVKKTRKAKR